MQARPTAIRSFVGAAVVAATIFSGVQAQAQITDAEAECRAAISGSMGKYIKALQKAVNNCHKLRNKGKVVVADCNDFSTADVIAKNKPSIALNDAVNVILSPVCTSVPSVLTQFGRCPAPFEAIDDFTGGSGIDTTAELFDCLRNHINNLVHSTGDQVLGNPTASPSVTLTKEQQKCHAAIAKGYAKVLNTTVKERATCQKGLDKDGGPLAFNCANADSKNKILTAINKAEQAIADACSNTLLTKSALAQLDSCAVDAAGLEVCAIEQAAKGTASGAADMLWELPGVCPTKGSYQLSTNPSATEVDTGSPGLVHDMDPILGFGGVQYAISCDADCGSCSSSTISPASDSCRCVGDASVGCSTNGDCSGFGGTCQCFYGPPAAYSAGSTPACVTTQIDSTMTGSFAPGTGDIALSMPVRIRIYLGITQFSPCPRCVGGSCNGGARNGLSCSVDATDPTFGDVSYDCPPSNGVNISGAGRTTTFNFTTGLLSLPFNVACDSPHGALMCPCSTCSLNNQIACNSDAECAAASAGVCRTDGLHGGESRSPNDCSDGICSPDPNGDVAEGTCLAGPIDKYCDGFLRSSGKGILGCFSNADCDAFMGACPGPGASCGACTLSQNRDCFLDPITAQGAPGQRIVGEGCMAPSANAGVNGVCGWPGPYRVKQNIAPVLLCSDGVTPFYPPGGSNCP